VSSAKSGRRWLRRWRRPQLALVALLVAVGIGYAVDASQGHHPASGPSASAPARVIPDVSLSSLPAQVGQTVRLIQHGGPFPYAQDGVVFDNNEHLLPGHQRGYYHEYTVPTPGASDRATRRIVTGAGGQYYFTNDHYASFALIVI
jgi:ribonuclease T1